MQYLEPTKGWLPHLMLFGFRRETTRDLWFFKPSDVAEAGEGNNKQRSCSGAHMCRSIKTLRGLEEGPTEEEIQAAALQFVRKISGYRQPSKANQKVFDRAVREISRSSTKMLDELVVRA